MIEPADRVLDVAASAQRALDLAYQYLARRDRTVAEVRRHLEGKRVEPDLIDRAVVELVDQGYLDDARYAVRFTEDRRTLDSWGVERIERRLLSAGVSPEHVAAALDERPAEDELAAAVQLLERRVGVPPPDDRERERALRLLVRRGYQLETAYDAVRAFERQAD